jgi:hypothetical protein
MNSLDRTLVAVVTSGASWVTEHVDALRAAGARVRVCAPDQTLWSILSALDYEAILIADVEMGVKALGRALSEDGRLRTVPSIALVAPGETPDRDPDHVAVDGAAPQDTVATVAELVGARSSPIGSPASSTRPGTLRLSSLPPAESPARRELEAGFHDLRVLLGVIVGYGSNLRDGAGGALSEAHRDNVLKMIEAATDATAILEQTIVASRSAALGVPTANPARTQRSHVEIAGLAAAVVRMFGKAAELRRIELTCAAAEPIRIWGNAVQLKQVVANLVVNALKFVPAGGRVCVTTRLGIFGNAEIVVTDTGPGVPPGDRERIFDHRVRLDRDAGIGGTGIGLALVRELVVVHHGGAVRVDDAAGGGAEFVVSLPLDRRSRARDSMGAREPPTQPGFRAGDAE